VIIRLDKQLKYEDIYANGAELAGIMGKDRLNGKRVLSFPKTEEQFVYRFKSPVLMTNNYEISQLEPTLRETLFSLFASRPRIVEYDDVSVSWDNSHISVWCPSIDTIFFAKALGELLSEQQDFKKAIEIGCGSGFLSKYALSKLKNLEHILINDINPYAIKCAQENINDPRAGYFLGNGIEKLKDSKYDLVIANPPYVPRPESIEDNPYEGVGLLNYLVHNTDKFLNEKGILITNISSLSWDLVFPKGLLDNVKIIDKLEVPLKVNNILNNKEWLDYLINKRNLKKQLKEGYEYWQEIMILIVEN
jgi:16S rRNA G966 N2-methylase RsmD